MKRIPSALVYFLFVMAVFGIICARDALGQTSCTSPTGACVPVQVTATVNNNTALMICVGNSTMCSQTTLDAYIKGSTTTSWTSAGFVQKAAVVTYNDFHSYNSTIYYAANSTPQGGPSGPVSAITFFQMPQAPTPPTLTVGPKVVTSGNVGVQ